MASHPLVQVLALGSDAPGAASLAFKPIPYDDLDTRVAPEGLHHVRDADASQRRCVLAARDGHSFVMDGPPGTGKSQTITNVIAELLFDGKTVLFVSDKAAALEVVRNRLRASRLDEFALELHSHNATRKAVAHELGQALTRRPQMQPQLTDVERTRLTASRIRLAGYASAMNVVRSPLNRSLHDVLGRLADLSNVLSAPSPEAITLALDTPSFASLIELAEGFGRAWGPVERSDRFLWRDLQSDEVSPSVFEGRRRLLADTMEAVQAVERRLVSINDELGLALMGTRDAALRVLGILSLLDHRYSVSTTWLYDPNPTEVDRVLKIAADGIGQLNQGLAALLGVYEARWRGLAPDDATSLSTQLKAVQDARLPVHIGGEQTLVGIRALQSTYQQAESDFASLADRASTLASAFAVNPSIVDTDFLERLSRLAQLADPVQRPEAVWFDRGKAREVADARSILDTITSDLKAARLRVEEVFRPSVLDLDLRGLRARFTDRHKGLRKLGSAYRADKRLLATHVLSGKVDAAVLDRLPDAITVQSLAANLQSAESKHAAFLGAYYEGETTSFDRIDQALEVAKAALTLAGADVDTAALQRRLSIAEGSDPKLVAIGLTVVESLQRLDARVAQSARGICVFEVAAECRQTANTIGAVAGTLQRAESQLGVPQNIRSLQNLLEEVSRVHDLERWLAQQTPIFQQVLGPIYIGLATDWDQAHRAVEWSELLRRTIGESISADRARALLGCTFASSDLRPLVDELEDLVNQCLAPFTVERAGVLRDDLNVSFADAERLLTALYSTVGEAEEWIRYDVARRELSECGLSEVAELCIERQVDKSHVAAILERAILERWSELVLIADKKRLSPLSSSDRDGLVEDFRRFDERLASDSAAVVVNACSEGRPTTIIGETQIIKREAEKQRKHMPIHTLLDKAGRAAQALKPCFMMSPLSVSQYLPPDLEFDVVIFDEASQVRPSDAINCVYRGKQLIVAGDQKQLPPTAFFQLASTDTSDTYVEDELDDFQSVLDLAKASAALQSLPLTWHYRSEHEALITYSNRQFYDSSLTTFPSSLQEADDIGIEFFKVDGVYERGTSRTNPTEARKVVDRVLHHRREHPHLSVGVIAFSVAQQEAIETAMEDASLLHPDLLAMVSEDRLDGFFVKNLESVQGDERDIIIFSIGYGPDADGKFTSNFGPLIRAGGWRRLNVAITRARRRVEVVASFLPSEISSASSNAGTRHLRGYLEFARTGEMAAAATEAHQLQRASRVADVVATTIEGWGYSVERNVGAGALRVDVGVRHPTRLGEFLMGVECDGEAYGAAAVTRDRDRLTQQVLSGLGWTLHRIWSTAWFRDRDVEERRLRAAINKAVTGPVWGEPTRRSDTYVPDLEVRHEVVDHGVPRWAKPYRAWDGPIIRSTLPPYDADSRTRLRTLIRSIVEAEGPVAMSRITQTVRRAWPTGSGGARTTDVVEAVVASMIGSDFMRPEDGFFALRDQAADVVRVPNGDNPNTRRKIDEVPWAELRAAINEVVKSAGSVEEDDLITYIARLFGWARVGVQIESGIREGIRACVTGGELTRSEGWTLTSADR